jgi:hypothetical protein
MFGWFSKNDKTNEAMISSHIAASREVALKSLLGLLKLNPTPNVFYYFETSKEEFISLLKQNGIAYKESIGHLSDGSAVYLHNARKFVTNMPYEERRFYCIDIFPLHTELKKLQQKLAQLNAKAVLHTYAGLNEPLFASFGINKILALMNTMGMQEDEILESKTIDKSIENAQKKIEEKVTTEIQSKSMQEWFDKNIFK